MKRVAIIGAGISGLGCAHFLHERYNLTIFEQDPRTGGHSNTIMVEEAGRQLPVDTGFMVFNHPTYPNLTRLFAELKVAIKKTEMSFSVRQSSTDFEYNGGSMDLLFVQRGNLLRPGYWRMLMAINQFNNDAIAALSEPRWQSMSLAEYVDARGYGQNMYERYLVPMSSAVWSTPSEKMADFPAMTLLRFWHNHGFLGLRTQHQWMTVDGGSRRYVEKLTAPFRNRIQVGRRVTQVCRQGSRATIHFTEGDSETFDKVVVACHGDEALRILSDPSEIESRLLRPFAYQPNTTTLHTDPQFMPKRRRCWAAWNYRLDLASDGTVLPTTHYWMNRLQGVSDKVDYFVSLNCHERIDPRHVIKRIEYRHPLFDRPAINAQVELHSLNSISPDQSIYFAGAWFKYGFHEDGFTSGLECARAIAGEAFWT